MVLSAVFRSATIVSKKNCDGEITRIAFDTNIPTKKVLTNAWLAPLTEKSKGFNTMEEFTASNPDYDKHVAAAVLSMPAAKLLGFHYNYLKPGYCEIEQPVRKELTQHSGFFQGGIVGALADFAGGSAAGTLLPPGWINLTADFTVKLIAPADGEKLIARGRVINAAHNTTVAAADLFTVKGAKETLCATALVTMRNIPLKG